MIKNLTKNGTGLYLMIPKALREVLMIKENTPLDISTDGDILVIKPIRDKETQKELEAKHTKFEKIRKKILKDNTEVFKRLAK